MKPKSETDIGKMFETSLRQALREEEKRADDWRKATWNIPVAHLFCKCGLPVKEKLLFGLLTASSILFDKFLTYFFRNVPSESQSKIAALREIAKTNSVHVSVVLLEHLASTRPVVTVKDVIDSLENACLYRVIADFEYHSMRDLSEHSQIHAKRSCCKCYRPVSRMDDQSILPWEMKSPGIEPDTDYQKEIKFAQSKDHEGFVLLTFTKDGIDYGQEIKEILQRPSEKSQLPYIVFTLSDFSQQLNKDHVKHILWILSKVDFVVPILTDGYMHMLETNKPTSSHIEEIYAPHLAKVLIENWAYSFRNELMRCFRPPNAKWPQTMKIVYPPLLTSMNDPSRLREILKKPRG